MAEEKKPPLSAEEILALGRTFQTCMPLLAAVELGVPEILREKAPLDAEEAARTLGTDPRGTEILLDALAAQGILEKGEKGYRIPPGMEPLFGEDDEESVLPMLRHYVHMARTWVDLAGAVRRGGPDPERKPFEKDERRCRAFIGVMHVVGRKMAPQMAAAMAPARFKRFLDVGGGSGTYTIALLREAPGLKATLFDLPQVIPLARERLEREGLLGRVRLEPGDFNKDPLPVGHDMVLLSAIIHQNSREENRRLYRSCGKALEPGGVLIIRDIVMDESRTSPPEGALFAVNMLVHTRGGRTFSFSEIREDLEAAGYREVRLARRGAWMDSLVEALA